MAWRCEFGVVDDYVFNCKGKVAWVAHWSEFFGD